MTLEILIKPIFHEKHDLENRFVADSEVFEKKSSPHFPEGFFTPIYRYPNI
jgi:hypothetical protein